MILSDRKLIELIEKHKVIKIEPYSREYLDDVSYELHLSSEFVSIDYLNTPVIDVGDLSKLKYKRFNSDKIVVQPHHFVLGRSLEWVELPSNITAFVSGKSSLARLGLQVHAAALIHPGSRGHVVLEIFNHNNVPIILRKGMAIAQLVFFENNEPIEDYAERKGLYLNQKRIELPREISFFVQ